MKKQSNIKLKFLIIQTSRINGTGEKVQVEDFGSAITSIKPFDFDLIVEIHKFTANDTANFSLRDKVEDAPVEHKHVWLDVVPHI